MLASNGKESYAMIYELFDEFALNDSGIQTIKIDDYLAGGWFEYDQNVTDHRPVALKLFIDSNLGIKEVAENEISNFMNYPNPFNPSTTISYSLPINSQIKVEVFDVRGRLVHTLVDDYQTSGVHAVEFENSSLPTGTYFCKMTAGDYSSVRKMLLIR